MKEYGRSRSIASLILNPGTGGQWVASFTLLPLYTQGQHPWYKDLHLLCSSEKPFMPNDKPRTIQKNVSNTRVHPKWHTHARTHPHSPTCTCVLTHTDTHRRWIPQQNGCVWGSGKLVIQEWQRDLHEHHSGLASHSLLPSTQFPSHLAVLQPKFNARHEGALENSISCTFQLIHTQPGIQVYSKALFHNKGKFMHRSLRGGGWVQRIAEPWVVVWGFLLARNYPGIRSNTASNIIQ
jgi:hypothetical protein